MKLFLKTQFQLCLVAMLTLDLMACSETQEAPVTLDQTSLRLLNAGPVVGVKGHFDNHAWLGIPFAKAPVRELRWKAPVERQAWTETLEANQHGAACVQAAGSVGGMPGEKGTITGSEDCLYLSVYAPAFTTKEVAEKALPIMVWVHGGGNTHGAGSMYDGSRLAAEQNVIVVSINYRLGPLGWFLHPALNHNGTEADKSGNYGTLDILMALEWVQKNAEFFGGDVNNVTLFGESAGAFDLLSLMLSPLSEGLFHKAVSQSGRISLNPVETAMNYVDDDQSGHEFSSQQVELYLHVQDGSAKDVAVARALVNKTSLDEGAQYLRDKGVDELYDAYRYGQAGQIARAPNVFSDGYVLPGGDPYEMFANPEQHLNIPLIIGTNRDEFKLYLFVNPQFVENYFSFYPVIKNEAHYEATADYLTRMWKFKGVDRVASALYESGVQHADANGPGVWAYRFDWDEHARPLGIELDKLIGAGHGMEIPFVFGFTSQNEFWSRIQDESNQDSREALSKSMRNYWGEFAHKGNPGKGQAGKERPWLAWNGASSGAMKYMILDSVEGGDNRMSNEIVSIASIESDIAVDQRLEDDKSKCAVFAALTTRAEDFWPAQEYPQRLGGACQAFPLSDAD